MQQIAWFTFYGNLNDFLSKKDRYNRITYSFRAIPSIKDALEAIGIPHVEVEWLLVNGMPVSFSVRLQPGDQVEVFPLNSPPSQGSMTPLRDYRLAPRSFVLDTHLGALARRLRLLGIDTCYQPTFDDREIAHIAYTGNRIVLTRDIPLLKQKIIEWGYWLRSQLPAEQLLEVIKRYDLASSFRPFTRCLSCNGPIRPVEKEAVLEHLPHNTREYFNEFYQCSACGKVYWKGSHYKRMVQAIEALKAKL